VAPLPPQSIPNPFPLSIYHQQERENEEGADRKRLAERLFDLCDMYATQSQV